MTIRPEQPADYTAIAEVVGGAFSHHPEVVAFVEAIRASPEYVPELALVSEDGSGVVAHVMLSWAGLEGGDPDRILVLTPMSVRPDRQRQGFGSALVREALVRAERFGAPAVFLEGIPGYYPRFGFEPARELGLVKPLPSIPDEAFMVRRLSGWTPRLAGRIVYPASYAALGG